VSKADVDRREADANERAAAFMRTITTRRVVRDFSAKPVSHSDLRDVLTAGRWATRGSNSRIHRLLVVEDRQVIRQVRSFSPGMLGVPATLIVICTDPDLAAEAEVQLDRDVTPWIDVGTAAMNMMLAAHAFGLGSCPVTSFSKSAVAVVLKLPSGVVPEFMLQLGHPAAKRQPVARVASVTTLNDLVFWGTYGPLRTGC
jgi:nitroreductase